MRAPSTHRLPYSPFFMAAILRGFAALGVVLAGLVLAACSTPPPKPVVTQISMTLTAGPDANPDARLRPSPLTVRVYALKSPGPFESADFFSLFEKDQATLGAEMAQREEVLLRPGESKKLEMTLPADVKVIGVMAAYRDLERARWREVKVLQVGKPLVLTATFGARQITIDPR